MTNRLTKEKVRRLIFLAEQNAYRSEYQTLSNSKVYDKINAEFVALKRELGL